MNRPTQFDDSLCKRVGFQVNHARPLCDRARLAVVGHKVIITFVLRLFSACRPSTISRCVGATVVSTFQRVAAWTRSHVAQERREVIAPLVVHRDPAATVVFIVLALNVVTAIFGAAPTEVFAAVLTNSQVSVRDVAGSYNLSVQTSATEGQAAAKGFPTHESLDATFASAPVAKATVAVSVGRSDNTPSTETSPERWIYSSHSIANYIKERGTLMKPFTTLGALANTPKGTKKKPAKKKGTPSRLGDAGGY